MYCRCGEQYKRRYINKEIIPPGIAMIRGSAVHSGAELNFKQKIDSKIDLKLKEVQEYVASSFDEKIKKDGYLLSLDEQGIGKEKVIGNAKDSAVVGATPLLINEIAPNYQPISVEEFQTINLPSISHDLLVRIDMIVDGGIPDFKVVGKSKTQDDVDSSIQLTAYAAAYRKKYGKNPDWVGFEQMVLAKVPKRVKLESKRDLGDYIALGNRIEAIVKSINAGNFIPAQPGTWACSNRFCGYYRTCKFVKH